MTRRQGSRGRKGHDLESALVWPSAGHSTGWPTAGGVPGEVADAIRAVAFEGLRVRRPPPDR